MGAPAGGGAGSGAVVVYDLGPEEVELALALEQGRYLEQARATEVEREVEKTTATKEKNLIFRFAGIGQWIIVFRLSSRTIGELYYMRCEKQKSISAKYEVGADHEKAKRESEMSVLGNPAKNGRVSHIKSKEHQRIFRLRTQTARLYATAAASKIWIKENGNPPVKVATKGCVDVDDFIEKAKVKLNTHCQLTLHTSIDGTPLRPGLKLSQIAVKNNSDESPLFVKIIPTQHSAIRKTIFVREIDDDGRLDR
ncbi:hypothetical protein BC830DRAFT_1165505 [Chytriomyces sp. MP71]|nr:hypothetical protein BC830DRAFT_1165505 [Chytriomyces sp. MP71]